MNLLNYDGETGAVNITYTWLPTWLGMDGMVQERLCKELSDHFRGCPANEDTLRRAEHFMVDSLVRMYPNIKGFRELLEAVRAVRI